MNVVVNGKDREVGRVAHLADVLTALGVDPSHVVVECDGVIVRREESASVPVNPGARVEIIQFVGGG